MIANKNEVQRDERTTAVENVSFSLAYKFIAFTLLIDIAYRSLVKGEAAWDLFAIIIISGLVAMAYQLQNKIINKAYAKLLIIAAIAACLIAFIVTLIMTVH